jgi:predicted MFS family arabinose efflux permease
MSAAGDSVGRGAAAGLDWARGALAWRIFLCFAAGYFMSYGLRSVNAVLAPELVADLQLSNAQLGSLSSAYFFAFALMQLPLGVWLDRYGPRRVNAVLMSIAAAGCVAFAVADSFVTLWVGRALVGVGVAAGLMASLTAFRQWFAPERQTQLAAWMLTAGTLGVLTATAPVQWMLPITGWRGVFWIAAGLLLVVAVALWTLLPRGRERRGGTHASFLATMGGYGAVFRNNYFWRMAIPGALLQGGFVALQTLWVGPWFVRVLGMSPQRSAEHLFWFNLFLLGCYLLLSWLAPRIGPGRDALVPIVAIGTLFVVAVEVGIAFAGGPSAWLAWLALAAAATHYAIVQPRVGLVFPPELAGRALTAFNLVIFTGIFFTQWGFGLVVDAFHASGQSDTQAFRSAMLALAAVHAAALVLFLAWPRLWQEGPAPQSAAGVGNRRN